MLLLALYFISIIIGRLYEFSVGTIVSQNVFITCCIVVVLCVSAFVGIKNYATVNATVVGCTMYGMFHIVKKIFKGILFICVKVANLLDIIRNKCYCALKMYGFNETICGWLSLFIVVIIYLMIV